MKQAKTELLVIICIYLLLTLLVWGLFALDRGAYQDDAMVLIPPKAIEAPLQKQLFGSLITPTRILPSFMGILVSRSIMPLLVVQLMYGAIWFLTGLISFFLIRELFPTKPLLAYFAGALTLTATGDAATNTLCTYTLRASNLFYFTALLFLLKWWYHKGKKWLFLSGTFLSLSVWTYDAAFASILLTPILLWGLNDFRLTKRLVGATSLWYAVITPYLIVFSKFLHDPHSYAAKALVPGSFEDRIRLTLKLFINNFTPWAWALGWRHWFPPLPHLLPVSLKFILSMVGTIIFILVALWLWKNHLKDRNTSEGKKKIIFLTVLFLSMTVSSNAIYSYVQAGEFYYRSQLMSGVWASLLISLLAYGLSMFDFRRLPLSLPIIFIAFGIYGGLESQDYLLGYWRQHKAEIRSIVEQVPGMKPDAELILYVPPGTPFLATEAEYLAGLWTHYIYNEPSLKTFLWSADRNTYCINEHNGFVCRGENGRQRVIPYERSILLVYSVQQNRYLLQNTLPANLLRDDSVHREVYNPHAQIIDKPLPDYVRYLLYRKELLASFFLDKMTLMKKPEPVSLQSSGSLQAEANRNSCGYCTADHGQVRSLIAAKVLLPVWVTVIIH